MSNPSTNYYSLCVGIEHLMTGLKLYPQDPAHGAAMQFTRESPSMFRVYSHEPFYSIWNQAVLLATASGAPPEQCNIGGHAEYYAQVCGPALADLDNRLRIDSQTYNRTADWTDDKGNRTRFAPGEPSPFPQAVVDSMVRKHGKEAFDWLCKLRWAGDHWFYHWAGMYCGVEPGGYIHT